MNQPTDPPPLPDPRMRWSHRRKAAVIEAIAAGDMTPDGACMLYALTPEELAEWTRLYHRGGRPALRVTRLHSYLSDRARSKPRTL